MSPAPRATSGRERLLSLPEGVGGIGTLVRRLARLPDERSRRRLLAGRRRPWTPEVVSALYDEVVRLYRVDLVRSERLSKAACWIAEALDDDLSRARGLCAAAHVAFMKGRYEDAVGLYQRSRSLFRRLGREVDEARTASFALQSLVYLGRYDRAFGFAREARRIFRRHGDRLRLARLDVNVGNILYRQDRFEKARELYDRAYREFRRGGQPADVAVVLRNLAVCAISSNDFDRALKIYREAREYCRAHDMPLLVTEADYNIAYLYYLRGEYTRAIDAYRAAREVAERLGDAYHQALCDLDESEMLLELNLTERGAELAERAAARFDELGMGYETAKALANLAIAASQQERPDSALELFGRARRIFVRERNSVWPSLIDLYRALLELGQARYGEARRLAESALAFFGRSSMPGKAALCELLLARLELRTRNPRRALPLARRALARLDRAHTPAPSYQAAFILGQVYEALARPQAARRMYQSARTRLEHLRGHLEGEELKIAFLQDKLEIYGNLVRMTLEKRTDRSARERAFGYIEEAKSRSLADLIAFRAHTLPAHAKAQRRLIERAHRLREELNWYSRRADAGRLRPSAASAREAGRLQRRAQGYERRLAGTLAELKGSDDEFLALQNAGSIDLDAIRAAIPVDGALIEFYSIGDRFYACVLQGGELEIVGLGRLSRVRETFRLLQFQLSKFRLSADYVRAFAGSLHDATRAHLQSLHEELLGPLRGRLSARHLIVVPHGFLHYLPFHALHDGSRYLVEDFSISYAPSASVFALCCSKPARSRPESLVLGVGDAFTPHIPEEVGAVASVLPRPRVFAGAKATFEALRRHGPTARYVHVATHGLFRADNPMFSSIRLGTGQLGLHDLYELDLSAELVTLSGCGTGLNVVVGGDELLGLVRGLLYAGAQAVLGTLWDVNDESTAEFMRLFYAELAGGADKAASVQKSMLRLRETYPHPYYWAPFVLTGRFRASAPEGLRSARGLSTKTTRASEKDLGAYISGAITGP